MRFLTAVFTALLIAAPVEWSSDRPFHVQLNSALAADLPAVWQRKLKQLSKNIARSRQALAATGAEDIKDAFKAKQWRDRIQSYQTTLAKVPASSDPLMASTKAALTDLTSAFAALESGGGSPANAQPTAPAQAATPSAAPRQSTPKPAPKASPQSNTPQLVSGQRVRVKKLTRDMNGTTADIVTTGPSPMQSAAVVEKYKKTQKHYADALGRYKSFQHDADVRAAAGAYQALADALNAEFKRAQGQLQKLGNVQTRLAALEQSLRSQPQPKQLFPPFDNAVAKGWVQQLAGAQQAAQSAGGELQVISPLAYLPISRGTVQQGAPYDSQDLNRLRNFANSLQTDVNKAVAETEKYLKHQFDHQDRQTLTYFRNLNPKSDKDRMNAYLAEGAEGEILERLDKEMALAKSLAAHSRAFGNKPNASVMSRIDEIAGLRAKYLKDRAHVLGGYKLPDPVSKDAARIKIAKQILAKPNYEFGTHGPVVLTTPKIVTKEKEVSRDTIKDVDVSLSGTITLSGTRETWHYKWEEFKFATPVKEKDSGDWYVWWITAKKFSSGWEKTPIGIWISGGATKGSLILEKNFR